MFGECCLLLVQDSLQAVLHLAVALLPSRHLPLLCITLGVLRGGSGSFFSGKSLYIEIHIFFSWIRDLILQTSKKRKL